MLRSLPVMRFCIWVLIYMMGMMIIQIVLRQLRRLCIWVKRIGVSLYAVAVLVLRLLRISFAGCGLACVMTAILRRKELSMTI